MPLNSASASEPGGKSAASPAELTLPLEMVSV